MCGGDKENIKLLEIEQISENNLSFVAYLLLWLFVSHQIHHLTLSFFSLSSLSTKLANVSFLAFVDVDSTAGGQPSLVSGAQSGWEEIFVDTKPTIDHRKTYIKNPCQSSLDFECENRKCILTFWLCHGILFLQMRE